MAVSPNTAFTSGQILTAAQQNNFPRGLMGYVVRTAGNVVVGTSIADVTGASIAFTAVASRGYLVTFNATVGKTSSNGYLDLSITDGSNNLLSNTLVSIPNGDFDNVNFSFLVTTLTAGAQTIKMRALTSTAGMTIYGSAGNPYSFTVQDVSPI